MTSQKLALVDVLAQIQDPRQSSGKRYSLVAILSLAIAVEVVCHCILEGQSQPPFFNGTM